MLKFAGFFSQSETVQKHVIKPQIKDQLKKGTEHFDKHGRIFTKLIAFESVQLFPELYSILMDLRTKEAELFAELTSDKVLDPIVKIVGRHLKDYATVAELKDKLKFSNSVHNMKNFGKSLLDISNYLTLSQLIANAAVITTLSLPEQQSVYDSLKSRDLVRLITAENEHLDGKAFKIHFESMAAELHAELNLQTEESNNLFKIYHDLADKYMPEFNRIRHALIQVLPEFIEVELKRIENICPHLGINSIPGSSQSSLTPSFSSEGAAASSSKGSDEEVPHTKKAKVIPQ